MSRPAGRGTGAERLAGVLDQGEAVPVADRAQLVELAGIPVDVHGNHRLFVRSVTAASTAAGSRLSVQASTSAKTDSPL